MIQSCLKVKREKKGVTSNSAVLGTNADGSSHIISLCLLACCNTVVILAGRWTLSFIYFLIFMESVYDSYVNELSKMSSYANFSYQFNYRNTKMNKSTNTQPKKGKKKKKKKPTTTKK